MFSPRAYSQLKARPDFSAFQFTSSGIAGPRTREVSFNGIKKDIYDMDMDDLSDDPKSEGDKNEAYHLSTMLILIIELYTERYPNRVIRLRGDTREKFSLYQSVLNRHVDALYPHFDIDMEQERSFFILRSRSRDNPARINFLLKRKPGLCFTIHMIQTTLSSKSLLLGSMVSVEISRSVELGITRVDCEN